MSLEDEALRVRALARLGEFAPPRAREALELGSLSIEQDVLAWEGSHGTVHAHRAVLRIPAELRAGIDETVREALTAAIAAAVADVPGNALADLEIAPGPPARRSPYRGRV